MASMNFSARCQDRPMLDSPTTLSASVTTGAAAGASDNLTVVSLAIIVSPIHLPPMVSMTLSSAARCYSVQAMLVVTYTRRPHGRRMRDVTASRTNPQQHGRPLMIPSVLSPPPCDEREVAAAAAPAV
eukprot:gnl/TRDRNA2_/TRDRNA2_33390_c0_seq1.p1 gnl/TRDRNA2_/TRDRNA2_33390_c0~~gnl/TRDRNA2_/TRDRNA2_33390_c0_seq1.p1  ORF type:complete len:128 (+),score=16.01 gnl/TRDRNA2_/TRDRNA2_33390_c0_seq1:232-615(+)